QETGKVTGLIDLEGMVVVPTWIAAVVPQWIPDPESHTADWYGGTKEEQRGLWETFHRIVGSCSEWREAHEKGEIFREVDNHASFGVSLWWDARL
ncbi:hypothetical protein K438DRAFT_1567318, partial [Mycena galopus ATCC 62051]